MGNAELRLLVLGDIVVVLGSVGRVVRGCATLCYFSALGFL
jgi:hypothetical protein